MTGLYLSALNEITERQPTVTAQGMDANFPATNVLDGLTWSIAKRSVPATLRLDFDFGAAVSADCCGFAGHNLHLAAALDATWAFAYSDNGTDYTDWFPFRVHNVPGAAFHHLASAESHRYWRVTLFDPSGTLVPEVAAVWLGTKIAFPVNANPPVAPPNQNYSNRLLSNFGQGGQVLGTRVEQTGGSTTVGLTDIAWTWWEANGKPAYDRMVNGHPFIFTWDDQRADAAGYAVAPSSPVVTYKSHGRMDYSFTALTT